MCCAHIIECLLDLESSVAVLRFVSNRQRRLKVLQHTFAQQVQLVSIDRHCASSVAVCGLPLRGRSAACGRSSSPQLRVLERTAPASAECHLRSRSSRRTPNPRSPASGPGSPTAPYLPRPQSLYLALPPPHVTITFFTPSGVQPRRSSCSRTPSPANLCWTK